MKKKKIWFSTTHITDDMKRFLVETLKREDYQIEYNELRRYTKKMHPWVITKEMTRAQLSFQHKDNGPLYLLETGIKIAKEIQEGESNLILARTLYNNHKIFKFVLDCILSFGRETFTKRQYYTRVKTRVPIMGYLYESNTSKYLNYVLGQFMDLDIISVEK